MLLTHLHARAAAEAKLSDQRNGSPGPWVGVERGLFGDPENHLESDSDHGPGFSASLMDGPDVDLLTFCGLQLSSEHQDVLSDSGPLSDLVERCDAAECIEVGDVDQIPGMSDVFYWIAINDADVFARQLREAIVQILSRDG